MWDAYFRWWEPSSFEYKVIARGLGELEDEEENHTFHHENKKLIVMATKLVSKLDKMKSLLYTIIIMQLFIILDIK